MGLKICVIEDDEGIQDVLRIILRRAGYETEIFYDGRAVMDNTCTTPDLFLIDKQLPGVDGITICRHLKEKRDTANIPVIIMSAYPNVKEFTAAVGANGFIEKPFRIEVLLATIKKYLAVNEMTPVSDFSP